MHRLNRRQFLANGVIAALSFAALRCRLAADAVPGSRSPNVLFIAADDLRCDLPNYGVPGVHAPNLSRLAARGMTFTQAHVQQAVCAASRASLLTGCRPDTTGVDFPYPESFARDFLADHPTIATRMHAAGRHVVGYGKIHHGAPLELQRLSEPYNGLALDGRSEDARRRYVRPENEQIQQRRSRGERSLRLPLFECEDVPDDAYGDGVRTASVISTLADCARNHRPFFLLAGYSAPHTPYCIPKRYWDLYNPEFLPGHPESAPSSPENRWTNYVSELDVYDVELNAAVARRMRHGYYASISYLDAQIGRLLDTLDELELDRNTLVFFWSDHGYHLGERAHWGKRTVHDLDTRAPVILAGPGVASGTRCDALVEFVDFYPTLCDYCGIDKPGYVEGDSFLPLLSEPGKEWKGAVFSRAPRDRGIVGRSVRTRTHRYIEWIDESEPSAKKILARECYDLTVDPSESCNLATRDGNGEVLDRLASILERGWKSQRPGN